MARENNTNNRKIEVYLELAEGRVVYRLNGEVYDNPEDVFRKIGRKQGYEIKWRGVLPFPVFCKFQDAQKQLVDLLHADESKLLKILND